MLSQLKIENYTLIDSLDISWNSGFSAITGETGAGKSIILGALGLILGKRADTQALKNKDKKCIVEGAFDIKELNVRDFFESYDLDYEDLTILRREINSNGKSRAFINDTPVNLAQLKALGDRLMDIHSQHETLLLNTNEFQFSVVDSYANQLELASKYKKEYQQLKQYQRILNELIEQEKKSSTDTDYFQFQLNELVEAELNHEQEQERLEGELNQLSNAEDIKSKLFQAYHSISDEEGLISKLREISYTLDQLKGISDDLNLIVDRVNGNLIDLQDVSEDIDRLQQTIFHDAERIEMINTRLDLIYGLQHKHHANSVTELIEKKEELEQKLQGISSREEEIVKLKTAVDKQDAVVLALAKQLTANRLKHIPKIEREVAELLNTLSMPDAILKIELQSVEEYNSFGKDSIKFLFSANKGGKVADISKVASGGELSRLMLTIKYITSKYIQLPTIIFDEIDTGVSGEVADKMGDLMKAMGKKMQVLSITHLPQIASKGKDHYFVYKESATDSTHSRIKKLTEEERVTEIAKMLSGKKQTDAAVENAKELLS